MKYRGKVIVTLKPGVFDPQGVTIRNALHTLSFREVEEVKAGKYLEIILESENCSQAEKRIQEMCDQLLSNPVIESYSYQLEEIKN
ncbi:phosphoribosylformylglycinamidine synthase subunit PurS [Candidatus Sordicultor fermentans]|jgi:phosphoribosylformylglycinamidine synthase|uniref:phosphoribosylformylglycinamidine synthase subunit PurS n=1 Tax=Candidatus Sordicultor fermentans TaxID=1953203 RepID=UPI00169A8CE0|nr:phosphoribosylformylglycinamidine synthase subunit PurS [Atribacterota bacterium]NLY06569.1 phosphoribosylformylglycinamidine synthase subunit PurS [Candidatus Atribacteria bacterium]MDI9606784.1 phosphoribosylformylglycinamidine synthase subunit PurS [Atribacterota bacterium]HOA99664.1 phosphoribosylformylglycinamidine synthase subunit PurS [Candidatus Atribacteria bacterium]HOQ51419.1 phosphoribosylformylglycinamidine synthase subunit PurS [Candidatus Atribacteria bacterium]